MKQLKFLDEAGREIPDPQPVAIPAGFKIPETLQEQMRRVIRNELSAEAAAQGFETFEESEDFDIDDDSFDPSSPYEEVFDPVLNRGITIDEFRQNQAIYEKRYMAAEQQAWQAWDRSEALRGRRRAEPHDASRGAEAPRGAPSTTGTKPEQSDR